VPVARLTTEQLVLRPPIPDDAQLIYDGYARDPDVARFVVWTPHESIDETQTFIQSFIALGEGDDGYPWIITLQDGTVIGAIELRLHPPWAEFGFNIARPFWNCGFGTETVEVVVAFALSLPGIERVQAMCHVDNAASARVMEKAGMRYEGRLRRYMTFPNLGPAARDVHIYARTLDDADDA
jgi:RimJ/RimL family protein N-acetyltransferase